MSSMNRFTLTALLVLTGISLTSMNITPAIALSGADWRAGRIVDDAIFRDSSTMTWQQIQDFLNSKNNSCDTWGTKTSEYGGGTRAQYGTSRGYPPPYTCLKDYYENTDTKENNLEGRAIPAGAKNAGQIIYDVSQQYRINPRVLLTLLQKEQTLVTDDWPWTIQYRSATGYGCPDTAPCDSQYYGFSNQVRWAARMFQAIGDNDPNWYSPYLPGENFVQWSPSSSCGGSSINIENRGTASLYSYTPYQPNQAALNNLYGEGDSCSAYGNRNFWRLFHDWFGTTYSGITAQQMFEQAHSTGALIRRIGSPQVYKIIDGEKLLIPNYEVFLSQGYNENQIKVWNRGDDAIPFNDRKLGYRSGTLYRESGQVKIYVIDCASQLYTSCTKRHISTYEAFLGLGYSDRDVSALTAGQLSDIPDGSPIQNASEHPNGSLVKEAGTGKIYMIRNRQRYYIQTWNLFVINRFDISKVKNMTSGDISLPSSETFPAYDSSLLAQAIGTVPIYTVSDNNYGTTYKKHISTYDKFILLGYTSKDVVPLEQSLVNNYVSVTPY